MLEEKPPLRPPSRLSLLAGDVRASIKLRELWLYLGWRDIKKHYSRSIIGPFWLTLSMGVTVTGLGLLYSQIFRTDITHYLPFLALGFIIWGFISGLILGSCNIYSNAASSLRQVKLPISLYIFQFLWAQLIAFAHNATIYLAVLCLFPVRPGVGALLAIPALGIILVAGIFISMILGPVCARFRDVPMIVGSAVQVIFFITPVIWSASQLPDRALFVNANPFHHFIEIVRGPLLGEPPAALSWVVSIVCTITLGAVAIPFFARYRSRLPYWA